MSKYFSKRLKLRLALNIMCVLVAPEFADFRMSAIMVSRSRFLPNKNITSHIVYGTKAHRSEPKLTNPFLTEADMKPDSIN